MSIDMKLVDKVLSMRFWPKTLNVRHSYVTSHDDNDGDETSGVIEICIMDDGDVYVKTISKDPGHLRFRTELGGGKYPKTRNALLLLAEAIRQEGFDSKEIKGVKQTKQSHVNLHYAPKSPDHRYVNKTVNT